MFRKIAAIALSVLFAVSFSAAVGEEPLSYDDRAELLHIAGFLKGTNSGLELERELNRAEAATLIVRMLGREKEALAMRYETPFGDVPEWATPYVGYLYEYGMTKGQSGERYGAEDSVSAVQFYTFILRALGYEDGADFDYSEALGFTCDIGLVTEDEKAKLESAAFLRADAANALYTGLRACSKGSDTPFCVEASKNPTCAYNKYVARVLLGTNEAFSVQSAAEDAVTKKGFYTMTVNGRYEKSLLNGELMTLEKLDITMISNLAEQKAEYTQTITEHGGKTVETKAKYEQSDVFTKKDTDADYIYKYTLAQSRYERDINPAAKLFGATSQSIQNLDVTTEADGIHLRGFMDYGALLFDVTAELSQLAYIYDIDIVIDAETYLIKSAVVSYDDEWEAPDTGRYRVNFLVEYTFEYQ